MVFNEIIIKQIKINNKMIAKYLDNVVTSVFYVCNALPLVISYALCHDFDKFIAVPVGWGVGLGIQAIGAGYASSMISDDPKMKIIAMVSAFFASPITGIAKLTTKTFRERAEKRLKKDLERMSESPILDSPFDRPIVDDVPFQNP